ncbi:MAG: RrF2 family transcriptional regulator [Lachnospiraceae bacterium]
MKLSTKGRYGLQALIDLAVYSENEAVPIHSIAKRQSISDSYLEQLVRSLRKAGLVMSVRGAGGGYQLAKPAHLITVGETLRALEGDLDAVTCRGLITADGEGEEACRDASTCVTKHVWKQINDSIARAVDTITIGELADESREMIKKGQICSQKCEQ